MVPSADFWPSRAGPLLRALPCASLTPQLWPLCLGGRRLLRAPLLACILELSPGSKLDQPWGLLTLSHIVQGTFLSGLMSKRLRALVRYILFSILRFVSFVSFLQLSGERASSGSRYFVSPRSYVLKFAPATRRFCWKHAFSEHLFTGRKHRGQGGVAERRAGRVAALGAERGRRRCHGRCLLTAVLVEGCKSCRRPSRGDQASVIIHETYGFGK